MECIVQFEAIKAEPWILLSCKRIIVFFPFQKTKMNCRHHRLTRLILSLLLRPSLLYLAQESQLPQRYIPASSMDTTFCTPSVAETVVNNIENRSGHSKSTTTASDCVISNEDSRGSAF
jgi:hypothetical protein